MSGSGAVAMGIARRLAACHTADLAQFVPWRAGGAQVGHVHRERVPLLLGPGAAFELGAAGLVLCGDDYDTRSAALAACVRRLVTEGELRPELGELYAVAGPVDPTPLLQIDRTAVAWFGVRAAGVHLNGYVRTPQGLELWVAVRSRTKRSHPGQLDNLVAGGSALGLLPRETLVKECHEEAGMPAALAARAVAVGALRYTMQLERSLKPDRIDLFDLELPLDFTPRAVDGEVESFARWPLPQVLASVVGDGPWKPNCALVVLDFLLRHGALDGYLSGGERWSLWQRLRGG